MKKLLFFMSFLIASQARAADLREFDLLGRYSLTNAAPGNLAESNFTINSGGGSIDRIAWLYQMPRADTITTACFRYGARALTPVAHKISIQTPSATTFGPDGTILGGGTPASHSFTPPADATWDGTVQCQTLDNSIALTQGQKIAVVIEPTGTPDASNNSSFTTTITNLESNDVWPVAATQTNAGAWARVEHMPVFQLKSASTSYGFPVKTMTNVTSIGSASSPNEYGNIFTIPATLCSTFKVYGMKCMMRSPGAANKTVTFSLYSGTTSLAHVDIDTDEFGGSGDSNRTVTAIFNTADSGALTDARTCGNAYYIAVKSSTASGAMGIYQLDMNAAGDLTAYLGTAMTMNLNTRAGAAWTDVATSLLLCTPLISDLTPASGGGVLQQPMTNGGGQ